VIVECVKVKESQLLIGVHKQQFGAVTFCTTINNSSLPGYNVFCGVLVIPNAVRNLQNTFIAHKKRFPPKQCSPSSVEYN